MHMRLQQGLAEKNILEQVATLATSGFCHHPDDEVV